MKNAKVTGFYKGTKIQVFFDNKTNMYHVKINDYWRSSHSSLIDALNSLAAYLKELN